MLRESKGNMYSWVTHTWNPIKGECPHNCSYCYMKRWGKQKPPRLVESEFKTDLSSEIHNRKFIFVGSSIDLFANDIPIAWIMKILEKCSEYPKTTFLFQTKNPGRLYNFIPYLPASCRVCTTIESNRWYPEMGNTPKPVERVYDMIRIASFVKVYATIEPIMDFDPHEFVDFIKSFKPYQVNIGADSQRSNLTEPSKEKILYLIDELSKFIVIDQKRNLKRLLNV